MSELSVTLVSREPWWAFPPKEGQDEMTCSWGWLEGYSDGSFKFDLSRPTDEEIRRRKSCRVPLSVLHA